MGGKKYLDESEVCHSNEKIEKEACKRFGCDLIVPADGENREEVIQRIEENYTPFKVWEDGGLLSNMEKILYNEKVHVVMNEDHSLLPEQREILKEKYGNYDFRYVPKEGWLLEEINWLVEWYENSHVEEVVFVSPVPSLLMKLSRLNGKTVRVFHNDNRNKKTLPNGKVVYTVAQEGWELV